MDLRPIGVFDSGLGGLTTVRALKRLLPAENIIYFGDTARVPYGTRSYETIKKYANQDIDFLKSKGVKMIVVACNTAASVIISEKDFRIDLPYREVIIPAVRRASELTKNKKIGVIGTNATINSGVYQRQLSEISSEISVYTKSCPLFVPLVENGYINFENEITRLVALEYLTPLIEMEIDTLILGCTHYPIIKEIIADIMGENVTLIDSGEEVAKDCYRILKENGMLNLSKAVPEINYYVSDTVESFNANASVIFAEDYKLFKHSIVNVEQITIG